MTEPTPDDGDRDGIDGGSGDGETADDDTGADWVTPVDDTILELLRDDEIFTPEQISEESVCRGPDAAYRCRELAKRGLVEKQAIGMYDITKLGERFLEGEVDPSDLELEDDE